LRLNAILKFAGGRVGPEEILDAIAKMLSDGTDTALLRISHETERPDPFKVLIGTILSHRTRDEKTSEATEKLFKKFRGVGDLAKAKQEDVVKEIRSVGFYNMKARRVIEVAKRIRDDYGGAVPDSMEELLTLPAVGRKTANCVLVYGFNRSAIPVDTHVHRISNRLGIAHTKDPYKTERALIGFFPKERWLDVNDLFVRFGKSICKPIGPKCSICLLSQKCEYFNDKVKKK
jgi:endonuclease-3